eukprot:8958-Amphidinium_carterae.1
MTALAALQPFCWRGARTAMAVPQRFPASKHVLQLPQNASLQQVQETYRCDEASGGLAQVAFTHGALPKLFRLN